MNPAEPSRSESELPELIAAGLPLAEGLRAVAEDAVSFRERIAFRRLAERVERGEPIEGALRQARFIPGDLRELVREGSGSGRLGYVLEEYLRTRRESRAIWRSFHAGLLYPLIISLLALMILLLFVGLAVPQFSAMYMDFGMELPWLTYLIITLSDHVFSAGAIVALVILAIPLLLAADRVLPWGAGRCRLLQLIPVVGRARRMAASAEFCSRLAVLIDCRVPLERGMAVLSTSLRDPLLRDVSSRLKRRLERGADPADFADGVPDMSPILASAFRWSGDPDLFADGLRSLAELFGAQARVRAGQVVFIIEPIAIVGIALTAAVVAFACFAPLIDLLNDLS